MTNSNLNKDSIREVLLKDFELMRDEMRSDVNSGHQIDHADNLFS